MSGVRREGWHPALVAGVVAFGVCYFVGLGTRSAISDEFGTIWLVRHPALSEILRIAQTDVHPPTHYLLLHWWGNAWGFGEGTLRLLSALLAAACLPVVWVLARRVFGGTTAPTAVLLSVASPTLLVAAQVARYYTLATLAGLLAVAAFLAWWDGPTPGRAVVSAATTVLAWYSTYVLGATLLCAEVAFLGARGAWRERRGVAGWVLAQVVAGALVAPLMVWNVLRSAGDLAGRASNAVSAGRLMVRAGGYVGAEGYTVLAGDVLYPWFFWATVPAAGCGIYLLWRAWRAAVPQQRAFIVAFVGVPLLVSAAIVARFAAVVAPLAGVRRCLVIAPLAAMVIASGVTAIASVRWRRALVGILLTANGYSFVHFLANWRGPSVSEPLKEIAETIRSSDPLPDSSLVLDPFGHGWGSALGAYLADRRVASLAGGGSIGISAAQAESLAGPRVWKRVWIVRANRWRGASDSVAAYLLTHGYCVRWETPLGRQDAYSRWFKAGLVAVGFGGGGGPPATYIYTLLSFEMAPPAGGHEGRKCRATAGWVQEPGGGGDGT